MGNIHKIREQLDERIRETMEDKITERMKDSRLMDNFLANEKILDRISRHLEPIEQMNAYYRCAIMEIETKFKVLSEQFSLKYDRNPIETIKSRLKSQDSILKKMGRKGIPVTLENMEREIDDIAGVRVICSFVEDVYMLADCLLQQDDITLLEKKDYIRYPKDSGYRSLHLIVQVPIFLQNEKRQMKVEVQIRTLAMDLWASQEHKLRYKKSIPEDEEESISNELAECAQILSSVDTRMQALRTKLSESRFQED
ncbi:GTP pyrophosphokinase [Jingyaoa shaoxingensis]